MTMLFAMMIASSSGGGSHSRPISKASIADAWSSKMSSSGIPISNPGVAPHMHVRFALLVAEVSPQRCDMLHEAAREGRTREHHGRGADGQPVALPVPFIGLLDQEPRLGMHEPHPQRQLPSVAERTHSPGEVLLDQLQAVLLQTANPRSQDSAPDSEGLADQGGESLDDAPPTSPARTRSELRRKAREAARAMLPRRTSPAPCRLRR